MNHYATAYPCGVAMNADTGKPFCTIHRFPTRAERDEWTTGGGGYRSAPDYREPVSRRDIETEIRTACFWQGTQLIQ